MKRPLILLVAIIFTLCSCEKTNKDFPDKTECERNWWSTEDIKYFYNDACGCASDRKKLGLSCVVPDETYYYITNGKILNKTINIDTIAVRYIADKHTAWTIMLYNNKINPLYGTELNRDIGGWWTKYDKAYNFVSKNYIVDNNISDILYITSYNKDINQDSIKVFMSFDNLVKGEVVFKKEKYWK